MRDLHRKAVAQRSRLRRDISKLFRTGYVRHSRLWLSHDHSLADGSPSRFNGHDPKGEERFSEKTHARSKSAPNERARQKSSGIGAFGLIGRFVTDESSAHAVSCVGVAPAIFADRRQAP